MAKEKMSPAERAEHERVLAEERELIRDVSVAVYKMRIEEACPGDVERMLDKDAAENGELPADRGKMLRGRAKSLDALTRCYIAVLTAGR